MKCRALRTRTVRRRRGGSERGDRPTIRTRSGIRNRSRRTRREKIVTQRDRTRGWSGFSRDVTAPAAGGLRLPTRTLVRFLGLIGCRPAPRLVHEESRPFYGYHAVPSFFPATLSRLAIKSASRRVPAPFARFVTRPRRRSIRRFSADRVGASNVSALRNASFDARAEAKIAIARRRARTENLGLRADEGREQIVSLVSRIGKRAKHA